MKRWAIGSIAFFATLVIGSNIVWQPAKESISKPVEKLASVADAPVVPSTPKDDFVAEFKDLPNLTVRNWTFSTKLIDVFESDNVYRRDDLKVRSGEVWYGLFSEQENFYLKPTKVWVRNAPKDRGYDDDPVQMKFSEGGVPIFIAQNAKWIRPGKVTTLYHRPSSDEIEKRNLPIQSISDGYNHRFELNGIAIYLRVSYGLTRDGTKVAVLVLESGGDKQIVRIQEYWKDSNIFGDLFWIGDLDGDGLVDFYMDEFNEIGAFVPSLYISSEADEGHLVKEVAMFVRPGC